MKIELDPIEQLTLITTLKSDAKRLTKFVAETGDKEYFADKLQRQKDLYKRIAGYDMNLPVLLEDCKDICPKCNRENGEYSYSLDCCAFC